MTVFQHIKGGLNTQAYAGGINPINELKFKTLFPLQYRNSPLFSFTFNSVSEIVPLLLLQSRLLKLLHQTFNDRQPFQKLDQFFNLILTLHQPVYCLVLKKAKGNAVFNMFSARTIKSSNKQASISLWLRVCIMILLILPTKKLFNDINGQVLTKLHYKDLY